LRGSRPGSRTARLASRRRRIRRDRRMRASLTRDLLRPDGCAPAGAWCILAPGDGRVARRPAVTIAALHPTDPFPMLLLQRASKRRRSGGRIGLAVAGGGPIGGMYELGALRALDDALEGLDLTRLDVYVGVSSGAFLAAGLANRMSTAEMVRIFILGEPGDVRFRPETFLKPAFYEYARRVASVPRILMECWHDFLRHPGEPALAEALGRLVQVVPAGLFDNAEVERFLRDAFTRKGRSNDFRELDRPLFVVAVDLDN